MTAIVVTGSAGLIGSEAVRFFSSQGFDVLGIDNDMRSYFFGSDASNKRNQAELSNTIRNYTHFDYDIRDQAAVDSFFAKYQSGIAAIIHTAAQPSHDWAAREPHTDFSINAVGTLNLLEATRRHCPDAVFIFVSTNKVYGDTPNHLPLVEKEKRWDLAADHPYAANGIDENMSIDHTMHSLFGASKVAADVLVQEYGRYFGMKTACFRGGCLTGPAHSGAQLHGFLAYLVRCAVTDTPYTIFGHKGKQVRDNIHSYDLVNAFWHFVQKPRSGVVYNIGGGIYANCSMKEAIESLEGLSGRAMTVTYDERARAGDHIWWVSDIRRFMTDFPDWSITYDMQRTLSDIYAASAARYGQAAA